MHGHTIFRGVLFVLWVSSCAAAAEGNRLTYLDGKDPYYVSRTFGKLTTPQWVGEEGVEAVVILGIDDMRDSGKYEAYLRPILERLKQIDGRAPVSIMTCSIERDDPQLQRWLGEGVSIETHTIDHPCPLLAGGDFAKAKSTFDRCVDLLHTIPGNRPVAFRVPCCDSLNTPSPRFYAEIFNKTTAAGNYLSIDTSVFNVTTPNDPDLPRELVYDADGSARFSKYLPADRSFVNTIDDYPYPYVIDRLCWEFPCIVPSDWEAQYLHQPNNPVTVRDMQAALDATVIKQGVFDLVFHPHGWIENEQVVELIDHAVEKHGRKVKFLNFREAQERLDRNLLGGQSLRSATGEDNGVRLLDLNADGYLDVVVGNPALRQTRLWLPGEQTWITSDFPVDLVQRDARGVTRETGVQFGVLQSTGFASFVVRSETTSGGWHFDGTRWVEDRRLLAGLELDGEPIYTRRVGRDQGVRLRDLDEDGRCELIVGNLRQRAAFAWSEGEHRWMRLPFTLPDGSLIVDVAGADAGLRFVDVDEDGRDDVLFSNAERYCLALFTSIEKGWSRLAKSGLRGDASEIPPVVRGSTDNGAWFHSRHLWLQNEDTSELPNLVDRRSYNALLAEVDPQPKTPEQALCSMHPRPGFQIELVAAEPLVRDPVSFAWGPDGKFWVVEMADYPLGLDDRGEPGGRVRYLEDSDGDGRYDRSTLFLDAIGFPTGVMPWRGGVLVTAAPEIFYAEDTDGDGRADVKQTLYRGFVEGNQQHRVNGLRWGLDNWIYVANGDSGGSIESVKTGERIEIGGLDLRIHPETGGLEALSGRTQFGRNRDDWGNWFGSNNPNPLWHYALDETYLRRNPHVAAPEAKVFPTAGRDVFAISRVMSHWEGYRPPPAGEPGRFTSACSATVYRDDLFGPAFAGNTFTSEPVHNAVHRLVLKPEGATFSARRAADEQRSEFLASSDSWFRPTTLCTGPDGALWIADMVRLVIEHPEWIDDAEEKRLFLRAGHDKGRIYRVFPVNARPRPIPRLDRLSTRELVAALESPNGWQRDLVQQMLVSSNDASAVPLLEDLCRHGQRPQARLHALCTLDGLGALEADLIQQALVDPDAGVRRHAVRLAEPFLAKSSVIGPALLALQNDASAEVRLQLAYCLGEWDHADAGRALGLLAARNPDDPLVTAAVLSSAARRTAAVIDGFFSEDVDNPSSDFLGRLAATAIGEGDEEAVLEILRHSLVVNPGRPEVWQFDMVTALLDALTRRGQTLDEFSLHDSGRLREALRELPRMYAAARAMGRESASPPVERIAAVRLLISAGAYESDDLQRLAGLLAPQTSPDEQEAVVQTLARLSDESVVEWLLREWPTHSPRLRSLILDTLLGRAAWAGRLLDRLEAGSIPPAEIDAAHRQQLLEHASAGVRERAAALLHVASDATRSEVVERFRHSLESPGDAMRGIAVFRETCASCHRLGPIGNHVGPDLRTLENATPEALLTAVLDPNRAVEAKFVNYVAVTIDGRSRTGMLASESGTSITLIGQEGKEEVILRADVEVLKSTGKSMMPEGLEKDLSASKLADLIAYLLASRAPGGE